MQELDKLEAYLKENGYTYTREDEKHGWHEWHQIIVYKGKEKDLSQIWFDAVCHLGSYGYEQGLLEIMGDIENKWKASDDVEGYLKAETIIERLKKAR